MVIQRLESETNSSTSDITRQHRMEIEKLKAENADEIKKLHDEHNLSLDKIIEIQEKMKNVEEEKRQVQKELIKLQHESTIKVNNFNVYMFILFFNDMNINLILKKCISIYK